MTSAKKTDIEPAAMPKLELVKRYQEAMELLSWVARTMGAYNANGKATHQFCRLCPQARLHRQKCRHKEIWDFVEGQE